MSKSFNMKVLTIKEIALDTIEMELEHPEAANMAVPGQFLYLLVEGHTLRRPISIAKTDAKQGTVTILFKMIGEGTRRLSNYKQGSFVNALRPSGNGFFYNSSALKRVLLIGGGIGVPPLYNLGLQLHAQGIEVVSILGFQKKDYVFYEDKFNQLGETYIVTDDGSYGRKGLVTDVVDQAGTFDYYFSCGPLPMLRAVTNRLEEKPGSISLEERMGCGIGACFACVVPADTEGGYRKICKDGPVFAANEVML